MKQTLLAVTLATQLLTQLHAGGHIEPVEVTEPEVLETEAETTESKFYVVAKGMMVLGDTVDEENSILDGDKDYGFGIDVGYRLGNGFAVEYDFSYATNTVTETAGGEVRDASAKYYTSALDLVYTLEATENIGIFGKVGV
ncbi:MAG TPA: hypothetical protein ENK98_04580 [Epsilonproteobacteria bacterium]|nr:hypothetical protein [Campylobacterota bacterium]